MLQVPLNFLLNVICQIQVDLWLQSFVGFCRKDNVVNLVIVKSVVFNVGRRHLLSPLPSSAQATLLHSTLLPRLTFFGGTGLHIFGGNIAVLHKIYFYIIFLSMGRYSLTESPSWVTIYFATESPVSIIRAAQCGRSWPRHENMFVLFTAVTVTGAAEPRRWMRGHGSCWRHLDPATGQLLSQDKLRDDGATARGERGPIPPSSFFVAKYWLTAKTADFKICTLQRPCVFIQQSFQKFP